MGLLNRHRLWQVAVDAVLIGVAWYATYVVGFQIQRNPGSGTRTGSRRSRSSIVIKLICLAGFGAYNKWWRYLSLHDVNALLRAVGIASIALLLAFSIVKFPRGVTIHPEASAGQRTQLALPDCPPGAAASPDCTTTFRKEAITASLASRPARERAPAKRALLLDLVFTLILLGGGARAGPLAHRAPAPRLVRGAGQEGADRRRGRRRQPDPARDALEPAHRLHADRADRRRPQQAALPLPGRQGARHHRPTCREILQGAAARRGAHRDALGRRPQARSRVVTTCREAGVPVKTLPNVNDLVRRRRRPGRPAARRARSRTSSAASPCQLDPRPIGAYVRGRTVLVTGAGGSIGSELCRQLVRMEARAASCIARPRREQPLPDRARAARDATQIDDRPRDRGRARRGAAWRRSSSPSGPRSCSTRPPTSTCR